MTNEGYLNHILTFSNNIKWTVEADKAHMENHRKKNGDTSWANVAHSFGMITGKSISKDEMKSLYYSYIN